MAKFLSVTFCQRCEGSFDNPLAAADAAKAECPYCGFAHTVNINRSGNNGTARTADSTGDASGATGITVT